MVAIAVAAAAAMAAARGAGAPAAQMQPPAQAARLDIRIEKPDEWKAAEADVRAVLESAAATLWQHFPGRRLAPIRVEPRGGPIVLYQRDAAGAYRVRLNTGETYWSQYAFQFAHEFCHILAGYVEDDASNKWFEESLCETASLYAIRRMAETWRTAPPYPHWKDYAPSLAKYAQDRLDEVHLPPDQTLAEWYAAHEADLRREPCQRELNRVAASVLLRLLEEKPGQWAAVAHLNGEPVREPRPFAVYLAAWRDRCPPALRTLPERVAAEFNIDLRQAVNKSEGGKP
jgi:hypothetical protein